MGGKEPTFVTFFLPEYVSGQAVDLLSPILESSCLCLKANTSLIGTIRTVKDVKIFPAEGNPVMLPRKIIFDDSITRGVLFAEKVVLCYRCKPQHILGETCPYSYTHPKCH